LLVNKVAHRLAAYPGRGQRHHRRGTMVFRWSIGKCLCREQDKRR